MNMKLSKRFNAAINNEFNAICYNNKAFKSPAGEISWTGIVIEKLPAEGKIRLESSFGAKSV